MQGEDFIPKQIVNFLPKPIVNVLPKQSVNDKHENDVVTSEVFRAPLIKPRGGSGAQLYPSPEALKQKLDVYLLENSVFNYNVNINFLFSNFQFSKLPPWTNRAGKKRKPDIPITARRLIPLAPRPPKIDVQTALKANSTKILTISPKLPQLLPAICVRVVPATDDLLVFIFNLII